MWTRKPKVRWAGHGTHACLSSDCGRLLVIACKARGHTRILYGSTSPVIVGLAGSAPHKGTPFACSYFLLLVLLDGTDIVSAKTARKRPICLCAMSSSTRDSLSLNAGSARRTSWESSRPLTTSMVSVCRQLGRESGSIADPLVLTRNRSMQVICPGSVRIHSGQPTPHTFYGRTPEPLPKTITTHNL